MAIETIIPTITKASSREVDPDRLDPSIDQFVEELSDFHTPLNAFAGEANALATQVNSDATTASNAASTATTKANEASQSVLDCQDKVVLATEQADRAQSEADRAAASIAVLPEGTINDSQVSTSTVYSSAKVDSALGDKQDTLVSGTNIKTVNGVSVLGSGDLVVGGIGEFIDTSIAISSDDTALSNPTYSGIDNIAIGRYANDSMTTGGNNIALGHEAGSLVTTGSRNVHIGYQAGTTSSGTISNTVSVGYGANAGASGAISLGASATTNGINGVAIGGAANAGASHSIAIGYGASAIGSYHGVSVGMYATAGNRSVSLGYLSGQYSTSEHSVFLGANTGYSADGDYVTILGACSTPTEQNTTGNNITLVGANALPSASTVSNEITLGDTAITSLRCNVQTISSLSDERDKTNIEELDAGLNFIDQLNPVRFDWNMRDGGRVGDPDTGFIAQELQAVQKATGITIPNLVNTNNPERLEAAYSALIPVMVKAIQELSNEIKILKGEA